MSAKCKDKQGRILRTGESQRKDGLYEYRYTDANKKDVSNEVCVTTPRQVIVLYWKC